MALNIINIDILNFGGNVNISTQVGYGLVTVGVMPFFVPIATLDA